MRTSPAAAVVLAWTILLAGMVAAQDTPLPWPKPEAPLETPPLPQEKPGQPPADAQPQEPADEASAPEVPLPDEKPERAGEQEPDELDVPSSPDEERAPEPWTDTGVAQARAACREALSGLAIVYQPVDPIGDAQGCGIAAPIVVSSVGDVQPVAIEPPATLNCTLAAALYNWVETVLQPAAREELETPVSSIRNASSYVCRRRNNRPDGKLSEHALGNALDLSAFSLTDGRTVTIADGWPSTLGELLPGSDARFLKALHAGACTIFSTILGPDSNASHHDHFHFDLGRGGRYLICE